MAEKEYSLYNRMSGADSPNTEEVLVSRVKNAAASCAGCFYVCRGSFPGVKQHEIQMAIRNHETINELVTLETFLKDKKHNPQGRTFRNNKERKAYIRDTLQLKIVRNPKTGEDCVPIQGKTLMLTGQRMSAKRVREETCDGREAAKEGFEKARSSLDVKTNKADIEAATELDKGSDSEESSGSDGSKSSSESSFGVQSDCSGGKPVKGKRSGAAPGPGPKKRPKAAAEPDKAKVKEKAEKVPSSAVAKRRGAPTPAELAAGIIANGRKQFEALAEMTPSVVWKSVIRTSELERRLGKGQSMQDELDALQANRSLEDSVKKEADDVQTKLYGQCVEKAALKDFCRALRQSSASALAEEVCFGENNLRELFTRCALPLFQDTSTLMDMIAVAAKRLMDALWQ
ncbi:unnamed protein product [Effrenium voratum]|nr:unnamed protein product [Effrenium voratum]CAJ1432557.1 unnamed protein product [Effrenium voratum]